MTITRSTSHILKWQTNLKSVVLDKLFSDYQADLRLYTELILNGTLPLQINLSSNLLTQGKIESSAWKQIIYKTASEIIRSQIKKASSRRYKRYQKLYYKASKTGRRKAFLEKRFSKLSLKSILKSKFFTIPNLSNFSIMLDQRLVNFKQDTKHFDEFIKISSTIRDTTKKNRFIQINLPIRHYKHSLKYKNDPSWIRKNSIRLRKDGKSYFIDFIYEKEEPARKTKGKIVAFDQGYKKLLSDSNGVYHGVELFNLYQRISNKKQGSKAFKRLLRCRDELINRTLNSLDIENLKEIIIEDLKYVKHKSKLFHTVMNKVQRWSYAKVTSKFERLCEENGILLTKVNPAYTSQTCSNCGVVDKSSRQGEIYYCQHCKFEMDADTNAAINILHIGVCGPYGSKEDAKSLA